jgi:DNA-directed RNA polymerase alpha subunit
MHLNKLKCNGVYMSNLEDRADLLDEFAMQAMSVLMAKNGIANISYMTIAENAYRTAEEMILRRQLTLDRWAEKEAWAKGDIDTLDLSVRTLHLIKHGEGIASIAKLCEYNTRELLRLPGVGQVAINEIKEALSKIGMSLKAGR